MSSSIAQVDLESVRQAWALKVLGIDAVGNAEELEKARKKTKDLYKRYRAKKKDDKAQDLSQKVLEAFEVLRKKVRKEHEARKAKSKSTSSRQPNGEKRHGGDTLKVSPKVPKSSQARVQQTEDAHGGNPDEIFFQQLSFKTQALGEADMMAVQRSASVLICKCGQTCHLQRSPCLPEGGFLCPACRVRAMDPFNPVLEGDRGLLKLLLFQPPLVPVECQQEAQFQFKLNMPKLQQWQKSGHHIEARMCCLDTCDLQHCWPLTLTCEANGKPMIDVKEPQPGHKRRDVPYRIFANLQPGVNSFAVTLTDVCVRRFALALVRTVPRPPRDICRSITCIVEEECRKRVSRILFSSMLEGTGEEVHCPGSDRSSLLCPITLARLETPVRGVKCRHLQCFDLKAYMASNFRMAAFNKRWFCPICNLVLRPPTDLFVDTYLLKVLKETQTEDEEIAFTTAGTWTVTATASPPGSPSSDEIEAEVENLPKQIEAKGSPTVTSAKAVELENVELTIECPKSSLLVSSPPTQSPARRPKDNKVDIRSSTPSPAPRNMSLEVDMKSSQQLQPTAGRCVDSATVSGARVSAGASSIHISASNGTLVRPVTDDKSSAKGCHSRTDVVGNSAVIKEVEVPNMSIETSAAKAGTTEGRVKKKRTLKKKRKKKKNSSLVCIDDSILERLSTDVGVTPAKRETPCCELSENNTNSTIVLTSESKSEEVCAANCCTNGVPRIPPVTKNKRTAKDEEKAIVAQRARSEQPRSGSSTDSSLSLSGKSSKKKRGRTREFSSSSLTSSVSSPLRRKKQKRRRKRDSSSPSLPSSHSEESKSRDVKSRKRNRARSSSHHSSSSTRSKSCSSSLRCHRGRPGSGRRRKAGKRENGCSSSTDSSSV